MNEDHASGKRTDTRRRGSYGIDAPYLLPVPALLIVANIVNGVISGTLWPFVAAVVVMACGGFGLYASKRGKFVVWAELLDRLNLSGDEWSREKAIEEAVRVLRPGGRLMIADIFATRQYSAHLMKLGMRNVERHDLGWRLWWSGPWLATRLVTAYKTST